MIWKTIVSPLQSRRDADPSQTDFFWQFASPQRQASKIGSM
jgi:hypothetical protein